MSYPTQPAAQPAGVRPTTVTAATWLLIVVAALFVVNAIIAIATAGTVGDVYREAYEDTEFTEGIGTITTFANAAFNLLLAAGFVVLALFNYRGKNPARIVTWVIGGLALCCTGASLAMTGMMDAVQPTEIEGVPDPSELQRMLNDALPGWYEPVTWAVTIISLLALLGALILLALPASNEFFRRRPSQETEPPPPPPYPQTGV